MWLRLLSLLMQKLRTNMNTYLCACIMYTTAANKERVNKCCGSFSASLKAKLRDSVYHCSGTAELFHLGEWSPICADTLKGNLPDLICEQAGCGKNESVNPINSSVVGLKKIECNASIKHCKIGTEKSQCNQVNLNCSGMYVLHVVLIIS